LKISKRILSEFLCDFATNARMLANMLQHAPATEKIGFTRGASIPPPSQKKPRRPYHTALGPHSRIHRFAVIDVSTPEGELVARLHKNLVKHVGGRPSVVQRTIIERCLYLQLRIALMDKKLVQGGNMTEMDSNTYIAWSNALVRTMSRLGFSRKRNGKASLDEILAGEADEQPG
jgi:hypothetical protein